MFNITQSPLAFAPKYHRYPRKPERNLALMIRYGINYCCRFVYTDHNHATYSYSEGRGESWFSRKRGERRAVSCARSAAHRGLNRITKLDLYETNRRPIINYLSTPQGIVVWVSQRYARACIRPPSCREWLKCNIRSAFFVVKF